MQRIDLFEDDDSGCSNREFDFLSDVQSGENKPKISVRCRTLLQGRSAGVQEIRVDTGAIVATILPTRGMGLWKADLADGWSLGWNSPVGGPIHPAWVRVSEPSGLGWLDGFDELLVRCGLTSNGAPEFESDGKLKWPLHGRIANLAASQTWIEYDQANAYLDIVGIVPETRFLICNLQLETRYRFQPGSAAIQIFDAVTNRSSQPASMQLLYHINLGQPLLNIDCEVLAAAKQLAPRDATAADAVEDWPRCQAPKSGFAEQVFFVEPIADANNRAWTGIVDSKKERGVAVTFDIATLPYLNIWKNFAAEQDGYVCGLEPATGFPNIRSFEENQGRVATLKPGERREFFVGIEPLLTPEQIGEFRSRIDRLQGSPPEIYAEPKVGWSPNV